MKNKTCGTTNLHLEAVLQEDLPYLLKKMANLRKSNLTPQEIENIMKMNIREFLFEKYIHSNEAVADYENEGELLFLRSQRYPIKRYYCGGTLPETDGTEKT